MILNLARWGVFGWLVILVTPAVVLPAALFNSVASYGINGDASIGGSMQNWGGSDFKSSVIFGSPATLLINVSKDIHNGANMAVGNTGGSVSADMGSLHAEFFGTLVGGTSAANQSGIVHLFQSDVQARWQDTTIISTGHPGQVVKVHGWLAVNGSLQVDVSGPVTDGLDAQFKTTASLTAPANSGIALPTPPYEGAYIGTAFNRLSHVGKYLNLPAPRIPVTMTMLDGAPFLLDYTLDIGASGVAGSAFSSSKTPVAAVVDFDTDFSSTVTWDGIESVTDSAGTPIQGWSITSASGVNYANPIPEPSTATAILASLALASRRRQTR